MSSNRLRVLCACVGTAALVSAFLTQSATPSPITAAAVTVVPTVQQIKPTTIGLISQLPTRKPQPAPESTELYDYVNPCLIPLPEIREITGEPLLFQSTKHGESLTANIANAQTAPLGPALDFPVCTLSTNSNSVKLEFGIGITRESSAAFTDRKQHSNDPGSYFNTVDTPARGLPDAAAAMLRYSHRHNGGQRTYSMLAAHTHSGHTVFVLYHTTQSSKLRQLATAALSTLDGSRYGYNK